MANNIMLAINSSPIKNGTSITGCATTGTVSLLNTYVFNSPNISDIESKYSSRWSNVSYYYCCDSINGGVYIGDGVDGGDVA